jgi:sporulation protein YabP
MTEPAGGQVLKLQERSKLTMTGVSEVVRFEENLVVLQTELGQLHIHGQGLQLKNLSLEGGQAAVEGLIAALIFEEPRQRGIFSRFRL